ncbi:hypothetical protein BACCAP_02504 [Pseudoflavonifractor capillosus ATCC 29799]|uniref:Uncharacterized protein n=1 Tax=Pseudoflavonifractor capillosus ATCC 29799 TaxID=411467 RepID=A6NWB1_9FIRM|nr:hypothetical protein BACCAP_02504 [Pseudoflavonifractor capillosus ATCC 29799]
MLRAAPPNPFERRISFYGYAFCERFLSGFFHVPRIKV